MGKTTITGTQKAGEDTWPKGILEALLLLQEEERWEDSLPAAVEALCGALGLDSVYVYELHTENDTNNLSLSLITPNSAQQASECLLLHASLKNQLAQGLALQESTRLIPASWRGLIPEPRGAFCLLFPILARRRLTGLLTASGPETNLRDSLSIKAFCQHLGQLMALDAAEERIREREMALEKSEYIQKAILNALPDLKFRLSSSGVFLDYFANPDGDPDLFIPAEQFLGKKVEDVFPEYLSKAIRKNLQLATDQRKVQTFEYPLSLNGVLRHYEARINAVNDNEVVAVVREITALKLARQELEGKVRELDLNNQKLQKYVDSNLQLENFAHTVSHDLREPVRTISSFSRLLQKKYHGRLDEDANTYLDFIASSAANMNTLIEDLLEYSRFNSSKHPVEDIPVEQLLHAVTNALSGLITERRASVNICTPLPTIRGNWTKINQLFQNLISNAIKFVEKEKKPVIDIIAQEGLDNWKFAIRDNGIGIKEEYQEQIFLLFRRLHSRRFYPGSGIGLSLCKRVVEQHGGRIWVSSHPGQGSTFYFTIPK
ncbi:MAG: PAS domain-containing protein [Phaeodactylibacter sp.]|nr:PAS domain-containing protein [Phaeodactylibacter sp.]MCB9265717.1 PAS domain-containing protein [Lewinellaceae bacterium]MCB9285794.1 PAS domain-containing protein [Lewinellaceae bacterium]